MKLERGNYHGAKKYLNTSEAAQLLSTSTGVLANLRYHGEGPIFIKTKRKILYDIQDIERWIDRHKIRTNENG